MNVHPAEAHQWSEPEVEVARRVWNDERGSAADVARALAVELGCDRSRCAVAGFIHRNRQHFVERGRDTAVPKTQADKRARYARSRQPVPPRPKALPQPEAPRVRPGADEARAFDAASRHVRLEELRAGACKWPVNAPPRGGEYFFCGLDARPGVSYCPHHVARAARMSCEAV